MRQRGLAQAKESERSTKNARQQLTGVVATDGSLHERLHPLPNDELFIGTEIVSLIRIMDDRESITTRIDVLVSLNSVPGNVDVSLDLGFLQEQRHVIVSLSRTHGKSLVYSPSCCHSSECIGEDL